MLIPSSNLRLHFTPGTEAFPYRQPRLVEISLSEYQHDLVKVHLSGEVWNETKLPTGLPVSFSWGFSGGRRRYWYGYLDHVVNKFETPMMSRQSRVGSGLADVVLVLVGTSWVMKDQNFSVYENVSVTDVLRDKARSNKLSLEAEDDNYPWPSLTQPGISDWQFCTALAKRVGFVLWSDGVLLRARSRTSIVTEAFDQAWVIPEFSMTDTSRLLSGDVMARSGAENPTSPYRQQRAYALDDLSGEIFSASLDINDKNPRAFLGSRLPETVRYEMNTGFTVHSVGEAEARLRGTASENEFPYTARFVLDGHPEVRQGSIIYLDNSFGHEAGYWYVNQVMHRIEDGSFDFVNTNNQTRSYSMVVDASRDSSGKRQKTSASYLREPLDVEPSVLLVQGQWRSERAA